MMRLKTSFLKVMGESPINKVLDFLIENDRESWSMNEISENAGVGYSTLKLLLPKMEKNDLIIVKKKIGKIKLFVANKKSPVIKKLYLFYRQINVSEIEKLINNK